MEAAREGHEDVVQLLVEHGNILIFCCLNFTLSPSLPRS